MILVNLPYLKFFWYVTQQLDSVY